MVFMILMIKEMKLFLYFKTVKDFVMQHPSLLRVGNKKNLKINSKADFHLFLGFFHS